MGRSARPRVSHADFWAIPEEDRFHELIGGELIRKASPSGEHGGVQAGIIAALVVPFQRRADGKDAPGGWWFAAEVDVLLETDDIVRPDVLGWRRERSPERPKGMPVKLRPDWVCEILSPSNATHDTVKKLRLYHGVSIPHYWIVDPRLGTVTAMRWSADGYVTLLSAERGEVVRAEPFDAVELAVSAMLGDDPPEESESAD